MRTIIYLIKVNERSVFTLYFINQEMDKGYKQLFLDISKL